jgi:hypothetical protein
LGGSLSLEGKDEATLSFMAGLPLLGRGNCNHPGCWTGEITKNAIINQGIKPSKPKQVFKIRNMLAWVYLKAIRFVSKFFMYSYFQ